jgi:hypothetical protein
MKDATRVMVWHTAYAKNRMTNLTCDLADGAAE